MRHAHKMEALGQLIGGLAHDFNNLLAIVIGNLDVLIDLEDGSPGAARNSYGRRSAPPSAAAN